MHEHEHQKCPNLFGFLFFMSSVRWLTVRAISISTGKGLELLARMQKLVVEMAGFKLSSRVRAPYNLLVR